MTYRYISQAFISKSISKFHPYILHKQVPSIISYINKFHPYINKHSIAKVTRMRRQE